MELKLDEVLKVDNTQRHPRPQEIIAMVEVVEIEPTLKRCYSY